MTPEAAALMRHNLALCVGQMETLALKAKNDPDAETFRRGAATYRRILDRMSSPEPERMAGRSVEPYDPPPSGKDHHL